MKMQRGKMSKVLSVTKMEKPPLREALPQEHDLPIIDRMLKHFKNIRLQKECQ